MKIRYGCTRFVLVFSTIAVKIPRIPIFRFIKRLFVHSKEGNINQKIEEFHINGRFILRYFLIGFIVNYREYKYFQRNRNEKGLVPVRYLLFGCIEIQKKGRKVPESNEKWQKLISLYKENKVTDLDTFKISNYSLVDDNVCMHDYGNVLTMHTLDTITLRILAMVNS